jgi:large subunit ribosomal protein L24
MKKYTKLNIRNKKMSRFAKRNLRAPRMKMKIKKGDNVMVVSGKDKGKTGLVVRVYPREGRLVVEGVAVHKRHTRPTQGQSGRIIEMSLAINASNVMVMDPKEGKPTRVRREVVDGKRVRIAGKSGTVLA